MTFFRRLALPAIAVCGHCVAFAGYCSQCSGYSCDEWIRWNPRRYSCAELEREYGCDCSGCECASGFGPSPAPRPRSPNAATLVMLSEGRYPDAKCLDGSQAGFYIRNGSADKFLVFFEGGGWCYDSNCGEPTSQGTLADCRLRSLQRLGSSKYWHHTRDSSLAGMLSVDAKANPVFHDYTLVYLPHCDGTSWSGDAVLGGLHFKGRAILDAILSELKQSTRISQAKRVVISGGSAGASAVYYHVDEIASQLQVHSGKVFALPDAGFFLDLKDVNDVDCWPSQMRSIWNVSNGYASLNKNCLGKFPKEQWKCLFPEYYADLISTPVFAINTLYDSSELSYTLRLGCYPYSTCKGKEKHALLALRGQHIKAWTPLVSKPGNGIWAPACIEHTTTGGKWTKWTDESWEVPAKSGIMVSVAVRRWLDNAGGSVHQDAVALPNNRPCSYGSTDGEIIV